MTHSENEKSLLLVKSLLFALAGLAAFVMLRGYPDDEWAEIEWVFWALGVWTLYKWQRFEWLTPFIVLFTSGMPFIEHERRSMILEANERFGPIITVTETSNPFDQLTVFGFLPASYMGLIVMANLFGTLALFGFKAYKDKLHKRL